MGGAPLAAVKFLLMYRLSIGFEARKDRWDPVWHRPENSCPKSNILWSS